MLGATAASIRTLREGDVLSRYRIVRHLGSGGMADVYEGTHLGLNKRVAIKVLRAEVAQQPEASRRFLTEGEVASRIRHPHVVDVTDVGVEGNVTFLVMEFLEGDTLQRYIEAHGRLESSTAVDLVLPVLAALAEAHRLGVVHRDIKPDNVFLSRTSHGQLIPKLVDFGISKVVGTPNLRQTEASTVLGTPFYMSPEQARGAPFVDARSDQFSAALMLYEAITGGLPYKAESLVQLIHEVAACRIPSFSEWGLEVPERFEKVVMRALSRSPGDRYERVEDFAEALLNFASQRGRMAYSAARQSAVSPLSELPPPLDPEEAKTLEIPSSPGLPRSSLIQTVSTRPPIATPQPAALHGALAAPPPPRRRLVWAGVAVAVVAVVAVVLASPWSEQAEPASPPATNVASVPQPAADLPDPDPEIAPPAVVEPPEPELFVVRTSVVPATALIELDDEAVGHGSVALRLPADGTVHRLRLTAEGHEPREIVFRDAAPPERVELRPTERRPRRAARRVRRAAGPETPSSAQEPPDIRLAR